MRQEEQEEDEYHPQHVDTLMAAAQKGLKGEDYAALRPTLHCRQVVLWVLGHAVGEASVDKLGPPAPEHLLETAGGILDLAALVEAAALNHMESPPIVLVAHSLGLRFPDRGGVCVPDHPCAIGATGAHAAAAIADHAVHTEELCVVIV
eukprot:CAMPEP_0180630324 /NCGR_PEP_ID=MMETSP1037_2-20121125/39939_1 /TAXON_ID=632150 /ORGANISM="Azadinium spinosum, Strain 3D9" /LENGTH=148 /DNA_ID=CAMNT_0022651195 /DNA_START=1109 /DNA_END=1556 /DNA_ORIENTATION=-